MSKPTVFLYSDSEDTFSAYVKEHFHSHLSVKLIGFDQLARHLRPAAWPAVMAGDYPAELADTFSGSYVVNRVFNIDPDIVQSGLLKHGPHELWLHVITHPLLNSAAALAHDIGTRGVSRSLLPLNTQWMYISDSGQNGIKVPRFALGFGGVEPDISGLKDPMQKSIWSYFDWKTERHLPKAEQGWHKFYVERPAGEPVICHYLDDEIWCSFPRGTRHELDEQQVNHIVARARECFGSTIGEILLYLEADGGLRFHAFSPHMTAAVQSESFVPAINRWIGKFPLAGANGTKRGQEAAFV